MKDYRELLNKARTEIDGDRPADALLVLLKAVRINRHGVEAQCALAETWERLGHLDQATQAWREALRWHSLPRMQIALARLLMQRGDGRGAATLVSAALSQAPDCVEALLLGAVLARQSGRAEEATAALRQAASAADISAAAWLELDEALRDCGETAVAEQLYLRLSERLPASARKILAQLTLPADGEDAQAWRGAAEEAASWPAWREAELNEALRRLSARTDAAPLCALLGRRYREAVAQRWQRQGGSGWPKRSGTEAFRVGVVCSHWGEEATSVCQRLLTVALARGLSIRGYALDEREGEESTSAPVPLARLGHLPAALLARWLSEEDCDLLLIHGEACGAHFLEVLAHHPAPAVHSWGHVAHAAAALIDGEFPTGDGVATSLEAQSAALSEVRSQGQWSADELRAAWQIAMQRHQSGDAIEADRGYSAILAEQGAVPRVLYMRGALRRDQGSLRAAATDFDAALRAAPSYLDAALALVQALTDLGAPGEALAMAARTARLAEDESRLWRAQGLAARAARRFDEAVNALRRAVGLAPGDALTWLNLGLAAQASGDEETALDALQKAALLDPGAPEAFYNLGALHQQRREPVRAAGCYEQAIRLKPDEAQAYKNLGEVLFAAGNYPAWLANFQRFEQRCPGSFALAGYALEACQFMGDWNRLDFYLNGLQKQRFQPRNATELVDGLEELLYLLLFFDFDPADMGRFYRTYAQAAPRIYGAPRPSRGERQPGRWRIGYLSGDVRDHVMGKMIYQWLAHHDRDRFEIFLFATRPAEGAWGERIADAAEHFEDISRLADEAALERLAGADLDLLIDCSTHTRGARPALLAAKPARAQVTSIASAGCLGLPAIDFKLTDQVADLPEMQEYQVEPFLALAACIYPYRHIAPAVEHGYDRERLGISPDAFVLGAFVTLLKLSRRCLKLWREILERLPQAVIALSPVDPGQREAYVRVLQAAGIESKRVVFVPQGRDESENQARYHVVDLVLDPMPFGGANGTIEALDMGVPVVTLCGRRHGERVGASILTHLGVTATIAQTGPEYVELTCRLAQESGFREEVRMRIRAGLQHSVFTDVVGAVRQLENAYTVAIRGAAVKEPTSSGQSAEDDRAVAD